MEKSVKSSGEQLIDLMNAYDGRISERLNSLNAAMLEQLNQLNSGVLGQLNQLNAGLLELMTARNAWVDAELARLRAELAQLRAEADGMEGRLRLTIEDWDEAASFAAAEGDGDAEQAARADRRIRHIETRLLAFIEGPFFDRVKALAGGPALQAQSLLTYRGVRAADGHRRLQQSAPAAPRPHAVDLESQLVALERAAPNNFAAWREASAAGAAEYTTGRPGNLSDADHPEAFLFRQFVNIHAAGRVLDVGCGPLAVPSYLLDLPLQSLAGIDPLAPYEAHPFAFAQSYAEFLPWDDASFDTVVVGTSLDHVYLLDRTLAEIDRVLVPGGRLVIWTGLLPGARPYDPYGDAIIPPDPFHLFHPGADWFPALLERMFTPVERVEVSSNTFFLALVKGGSDSR